MAKQTTKSLLAANWNPSPALPQSQIDQAKANYQSTRRQELSGTGIADQYGPSWQSQRAFNTEQTQKGARVSDRPAMPGKPTKTTSQAGKAKPMPKPDMGAFKKGQ